MNLNSTQINKYNRLYAKATALMEGEILLDGHQLRSPGWFARRRLRKARAMFEGAVAIYPESWQSVLFIGKILQRLGEEREALNWMSRAQDISPGNPIIAKEVAMTASHLGMHLLAAQVADQALVNSPCEPGLLVNSGVAHLLSGHTEIARERFREAMRVEPDREENGRLAAYTERVLEGSELPPRVEAEIAKALRRA
ncbi:MAG: hypothetical protein SFY80_16785 [Verrucomicrobiota bacterium]|nr:hypothetical protein [Verrucomicrobiota bacterium]